MARESNQQVKRSMCKQVNQAKLFRYYTEKVFFVFTRKDKVLTDLYDITLIATVRMLKSFTQCSCLWCLRPGCPGCGAVVIVVVLCLWPGDLGCGIVEGCLWQGLWFPHVFRSSF